MEVTKLILSKSGSIGASWFNGEDNFSIISKDPARPEFKDAVLAINNNIKKWLGTTTKDTIYITEINFKDDGEKKYFVSFGYCSIMEKTKYIIKSTSPKFDFYKHTDENFSKLVSALREEGLEYVKGNRSQQDIDFDKEDADKKIAIKKEMKSQAKGNDKKAYKKAAKAVEKATKAVKGKKLFTSEV